MILTMLNRYNHILIGLAVFIGAFYLVGSSEPAVSSEGRDIPVKRVEAATVTTAATQRDLRFSGVTRSVQRARLAFSLGGRLVARPVEVGDPVKAGRLLAELDSLEVQNAVAAARGSLAELQARRAQAERDVERAEQLLSAKAATAEEVEKTRSGLTALRAAESAATARLQETERLLKETRLTAPFDGTITEAHFETGEFVSPGRTVLILSGSGDVEVEVEVPESVVSRIAVGDDVSLRVPSHGAESFAAQVESVGRTAAGAGRLFPVVVRIPQDRRVVVGATIEMVVSLSTDHALSVPVEAVVNPGGRRPAVFRVADSPEGPRAEKLHVEVGSLIGDSVVVRGDLREGDLVVVGGQRGLLDGEIVDPMGEDR